MHFAIDPEVAGHLGTDTIIDSSNPRAVAEKLHYEFDGYPADDLVASFGHYLVSEEMRLKLEAANLTGFLIGKVKVSRSELFKDLYGNRKLPRFHWLKVVGKAGLDDFFIGVDLRLVVSQRALEVLQSGRLNYCDVEPLNQQFQNSRTND